MKETTYRLVKIIMFGTFIFGVLVIGWLHLQNGRYEVLRARRLGERDNYYVYIILDKWDRKVKEVIYYNQKYDWWINVYNEEEPRNVNELP